MIEEKNEKNPFDEETNTVVVEKKKRGRQPAIKVEDDVKPEVVTPKKKSSLILKDTYGEEVDQKDYFYSLKNEGAAPTWFTSVCGNPVDREDLIVVFNKVFKKQGFLFYKTIEKEVYVIIVPIKYSSIVGIEHDSIEGDFQKHAISFISEGSVNSDSLRMKLEKVVRTIHIAE